MLAVSVTTSTANAIPALAIEGCVSGSSAATHAASLFYRCMFCELFGFAGLFLSHTAIILLLGLVIGQRDAWTKLNGLVFAYLAWSS